MQAKLKKLEEDRDEVYMMYQYYEHGEDQNILKTFWEEKNKKEEEKKSLKEGIVSVVNEAKGVNTWANTFLSATLLANTIHSGIPLKPIKYGYGNITTGQWRSGFLGLKGASRLTKIVRPIILLGAVADTYSTVDSLRNAHYSDAVGSGSSAIFSTIGMFVPWVGITVFAGTAGQYFIKLAGERYTTYQVDGVDRKMRDGYKRMYEKIESKISVINQQLSRS